MAIHVQRRDFITLLGGAAAWPLLAYAQQPGKLPTIGVLVPGTPSSHGQWFADRCSAGARLDRTATPFRWAEGRIEQLAEIAADFVRLKVDVIVIEPVPLTRIVQARSDLSPAGVFAGRGVTSCKTA